MNLTHLKTFLWVVKLGGFHKAARKLNTTQPSVSSRIASLEARLGTQLLRRTTRRTSLTDAGLAFYERSVRILADLDEAESCEGGGQPVGGGGVMEVDDRDHELS